MTEKTSLACNEFYNTIEKHNLQSLMHSTRFSTILKCRMTREQIPTIMHFNFMSIFLREREREPRTLN